MQKMILTFKNCIFFEMKTVFKKLKSMYISVSVISAFLQFLIFPKNSMSKGKPKYPVLGQEK